MAQIGLREGHFMVCDVTLSGLREGVATSGQSLVITEFPQISQTAGGWPYSISVAGMIGDGSLPKNDSISGKVGGEVPKKRSGLNHDSAPVLLWEQAGIRYLIYLKK
jgi:hypothetical protein